MKTKMKKYAKNALIIALSAIVYIGCIFAGDALFSYLECSGLVGWQGILLITLSLMILSIVVWRIVGVRYADSSIHRSVKSVMHLFSSVFTMYIFFIIIDWFMADEGEFMSEWVHYITMSYALPIITKLYDWLKIRIK